ncbi:hypothetical protein LMG28727_07763 [Paraburkholderia kirstenboschensis]|nr:hypothetical protein LMG28727_07763 [Paraburkholderia kirstenboschensis]
MLFLDRRKEILELANTLGCAKKQVAVGAQRVVEGGNDLSLHVLAEIDQQVAAGHQINS